MQNNIIPEFAASVKDGNEVLQPCESNLMDYTAHHPGQFKETTKAGRKINQLKSSFAVPPVDKTTHNLRFDL